MKIKQILSACLAAASLLTLPAGKVQAAAQTAGMENDSAVALNKLGSYVSGVSNKDGGVAEIVSYDAQSNTAWVVNGTTGMLDILDLDPVTCATGDAISAQSLDIRALAAEAKPEFAYGDMTSVAVNGELGIAAVALQDEAYDRKGYVAILTTGGELVTMVEAGIQPDMLCFTPDGSKILVANEGEPREGIADGITDPAGSVTVVTLDAADLTNSQAVTVGFEAFDSQIDQLTADGVMLRKGALPSEDLEPEYIACTNDTAYVALQEANAIAVLDLASGVYTGVYSLGYKDLSLEENAIDLVEDGEYLPQTYPDAVGAYMPDGISLYTVEGKTYLLTANEGDAREWGSGDAEYCNEIKETVYTADGTKVKKVRAVDPELTDGMPEGKTVLFGGRSFSIYCVEEDGLTQIFDSGNDFEALTAGYYPDFFNCSNDDNDYDSRSPKKGPEAESVTVGTVDGETYAFVALERIGGIMMYDITDPANVTYVNYINTRDFDEDPDETDPDSEFYLTGDIAPEGLYFISAENSPSGTPILLAAFEVSGTVAAYGVGDVPAGHSNVQTVNASDATCTEDGYTGDTVCADCGEVLETGTVIAALGHDYAEGTCTRCQGQDPDYVAPEEEPEEDVKPEEESKPEEDTKPEDSDPVEEIPKTGDAAMLWAVVVILAAGAVIALLSKRKQTVG